jgi:hypothetical protein
MIVVAKIDPKLSLPTSVINFTTKQIAGFFLVMIHQQAREVQASLSLLLTSLQQIETNEDSPYRECIKSNPEFYLHWILPKLRKYIAHNGWKQPDIACLGEDGIFRESSGEIPEPDEEIVEDPLALAAAPATGGAGGGGGGRGEFYPYIQGSLYKKGNGIISSVWSYRHFEFDLYEQTLRWYKVKINTATQRPHTSSSLQPQQTQSQSQSQRVYRGNISIRFATAELLGNSDGKHGNSSSNKDKGKSKKKSSSSWKHLSGVVFVIKYYPSALETGRVEGNSSKDLSGPTGSPQEMYLSAPCLQEAYHWITHLNISSKIHLQHLQPQPQSKLLKESLAPSLIQTQTQQSGDSPSPTTTLATHSSSLSPASSSSSFSSLFLLIIIYLLPVLVFLFPESYQLSIAMLMIYLTPPLLSMQRQLQEHQQRKAKERERVDVKEKVN